MSAQVMAAGFLAVVASLAIGWKLKLLLDIIRLESAVRPRPSASLDR